MTAYKPITPVVQSTTDRGKVERVKLSGPADGTEETEWIYGAGGYDAVVTANTGTSYGVNMALASTFDLTVTGNVTFTFAGATSGVASSFTLILRRDATGTRTITFPASVKWLGAVPTWGTAASKIAGVASFLSVDGGTTWLGMFAGAEL